MPLLFLIVVTGGEAAPPPEPSSALSTCMRCHVRARPWAARRRMHIARWLGRRDARNAGHHALFTTRSLREVLEECLQEATATPVTTDSFYDRLAELESRIATPSEKGEEGDPWAALVARGRDEVPGFERLWSRGDRLPPPADGNRRNAVLALIEALRTPYARLHLQPGETSSFRSTSRIHVGRVLLFFGGVKRDVERSWSLRVLDRLEGAYRLGLQVEGEGLTTPVSGEARIDGVGRLEELKEPTDVDPFPLRQAATFLERGENFRFAPFTFEKTIHVPRKARTARKKAALDVTVRRSEPILVDGEPCVRCSFEVREKPDDMNDAFSLWGEGTLVARPDGVIRRQDVQLKFRVKVLGLSLVRGSLRTTVELIDTKGDRP